MAMLKLLELFSGIGAQRMALDRLGVEYKSVGISEISRPALRAYAQIHGDLDNLGDITRLEALPDCDECFGNLENGESPIWGGWEDGSGNLVSDLLADEEEAKAE